ncbi:HET-domain-containing protein [Lophium mytilinum]|uniref:HET-domain-containing protein n=1 Tax=Lophium mytilinum TaxID=390894 RepID=A0A6A6R1Y1_9PEZI|nr:HET-domain-containing protein [Lophium mytilinum]
MRLLRLEDFSLVEVVGKNIPRYAVLSHTWGPDQEEVTYKDIVKGTGKNKAGYAKIQFCERQASLDSLQYIWVDTCCINKSSSAELSEAINSMFSWYQRAERCYVYLSDVRRDNSGESDPFPRHIWTSAFRNSRWFTRGWTLQELLAPTMIGFFSTDGHLLGNRASLLQEIHEATEISIEALLGRKLLSHFSVDERMLWAKGRETKREEDAAYSLLGIFDIHMPLIYGEGRNKALRRLRREIRDRSFNP